jgi:tRNA(fMet)-specific endonuclease VapC
LTGTVGAKYLLDTVIVAGYFNNDAAIQQRLAGVTIYVASTTIGELYFGAYKSQRVAQNVQNIREFVQVTTVLPCTEHTADWYGQIKMALQAKGRPIPENDIWIAAAAMEHGLILATRDAHFQEVDRLSVEIW